MYKDTAACDTFEDTVLSVITLRLMFAVSSQEELFPPALADVWHQNWSWKDPFWVTNAALCCVVARIFLMAAAGAWTCPGAILLRA